MHQVSTLWQVGRERAARLQRTLGTTSAAGLRPDAPQSDINASFPFGIRDWAMQRPSNFNFSVRFCDLSL